MPPITLPPAFAKALGNLPILSEEQPDFNRKRQLVEQRAKDKNDERRRTRMGHDAFGFRKKKDKT